MSPHVLEHAFKTLASLPLLWVLPWMVILTVAALATSLERRLKRKEPPPAHFPRSN